MKHTFPHSPRVVLGLAVLACSLVSVPTASAQIAKAAGASASLMAGSAFGSGIVRGTSSAYDPINNVHLGVGGHNKIVGTFVNANGAPAGTVQISAGVSGFGQFPTVTFSPHLTDLAGNPGAFLVTWHANIGNSNFVHGRVVSFKQSGFVVGPAFIISDSATFWEVGAAPAVAYSPASRMFLVAWQTAPPTRTIRGRLITIATNGVLPVAAGKAVGPVVLISTGSAQYPSVAHNPQTNQFGIGYSGYNSSSAYNVFARVNTAGAVLSRNTFNSARGTYITDLAVNPTTGRFVMTWSQGDGTRAAEFGSDGTNVGKGVVATNLGGYDSGSLAYSSVSNTFLVVGHGHDSSHNIAVAELSSRGNRISSVIPGSNASPANGTFYPRVAAVSSTQGLWSSIFSRDFTTVQAHLISTASTNGGNNSVLGAPTGGGGTTTPPPPPPPPPPSSTTCTSVKPGANWTCVNGGWIPGGSTSTPPPTTPPPTTPPPTGCTTPRPSAGTWNCVNGGWVPAPAPICKSPAPGANWVCVSSGGWLPPGHPDINASTVVQPPPSNPAPTNTGTCTSVRPGATWTCVNGGWLPPGM